MHKLCIKVISLVSVFVMLFSVGGCSSSGEAKVDDTPQKKAGNLVEATDSSKGGESVELKVSVFDRNTSGYIADNNFQTKWIQEKFGDPNNIKVTFVPIPRWEEADKIKVLMAANQAPDVCFTYSSDIVVNFSSNGSLTELSGLIDSYAPRLKEYLGEELLTYGRWDGAQYGIPAKRVSQAAVSTFIRKDWLDKLNMPIPQTKEELYNTLKAFKEKDPGNLGDKNIPFSINIFGTNIMWSLHTLVYGFLEPMTEEQRIVLPSWQWPGFKEGIRYVNKLYNEGLTNTEFVTNIDGKYQTEDINNGRVGAFINTYDLPYRSSGGLLRTLNLTNPDAEIVAIDPFENYEGKHPKMIYHPNGFLIFVPKSSHRAVEAIKYLEWMSDPDVLFYLQNGEKGVHYTEENNGIPTKVVPMDQVPDDKKANFTDLAIIVNGNEYGDKEKNTEALSFGYPGYEDLFKQAYKVAMTDGMTVASLEGSIQASAKYSKVLENIDVEIFAKSITCKKEDFDATYDSLVEKYLKAGGQEVIDEKRAVFNARPKE